MTDKPKISKETEEIVILRLQWMLDNHDWYYQFLDSFEDGRSYIKGKDEETDIKDFICRVEDADLRNKLEQIYNDRKDYEFGRKTYAESRRHIPELMSRTGFGENLFPANSQDKVEEILEERNKTHGDFRKNFKRVAESWSAHLEAKVTPLDVALMMVEFKIARIKNSNGYHEDNYIDAIGYLKLAKQLAEDSDDQ
jgi:hypothetical protein